MPSSPPSVPGVPAGRGGPADAGATAARAAPPRTQRADARRNRARLLATAREEFSARGAAVVMEDIARRAGLAEGTVYRHFPTKADLVRALVADQVQDLCVRADTALTQQDAGAGLYGFLHEAADAHAGDRGFRDVVAAHYSEDDRPLGGGADAAGVPEALTDLVDRLTRRAQDAGALRPDVTATDLLQMIAALPDREPSRTTHLIVLLDGLRTLPATS